MNEESNIHTNYEIAANAALRRMVSEQKQTIKELVEMVDQLRQYFNGGRRHDVYLEFTDKLNKMQDEGRIE